MLKVMLEKKLVERKQGKQSYLWSARTTRQSAASGMVRKLVNLVFDGSAQRLVAHLVESGQLSDKERKELRRMMSDEIAAKEAQIHNHARQKTPPCLPGR